MIAPVDAAAVQKAPQASLHSPRPSRRRYDLTNEAAIGAGLLLLLLLGAVAMLPVSLSVARLWADDPLRSFGALLPPVALAFAVQRWRATGWTRVGSAWGLLPLLGAVLVARTYGTALIAYNFGTMEIAPLQPGLLFFAFGSGVALLLGGTRLWRSWLFPLCLLLCVNPVPHAFYRLDYPLQEASAEVARWFAHAIGLQPTGTQLQMMFAPRFGMVIVPGCNGIRGSATMVYLALLIGYVRAYRWKRTAVTMLAGLLLGYALNLVRLCCLVVYYRLALTHPQWQGNGETVDYWIGGTLFLVVTTLAGVLLLRPADGVARPVLEVPKQLAWRGMLWHPRWVAALLMLAFATVPEVPYAMRTFNEPSDRIAPATAVAALPVQLGVWQRGQLWTEASYGQPVWQWAAYRTADGRAVDVGLWLSPSRHYAIQSQRMNGSRPLTGAEFDARSSDGMPMQFASFTLEDTAVDESATPRPTYFAETLCRTDRCAEQERGFQRTGWFVANAPIAAGEERLLPLLFRVQANAGTRENAVTQQTSKAWIQEFAATIAVRGVVQQLIAR